MWNDDNKKIFADREVILEALKSFSWAFKYADDTLKADRELVLEAVKNYDCTANVNLSKRSGRTDQPNNWQIFGNQIE